MKLYKTIPLQYEGEKILGFTKNTEKHIKAVRQTGPGSFVVDVSYHIIPKTTDEVRIFFSGRKEDFSCAEDAFIAVNSFIKVLNEGNTGVKGFDFYLAGCVEHPIDYNSKKQQDILLQSLLQALKEK